MAEGAGKRRLKIAICHPDLGIGGAERLVVDAALELKDHGHDVHVFTAHHDPRRCFEETVNGSFPVTVYGDFLPRNLWNKFHALFAYLRCMYVAICMILFWPAFDVVFVDQVSAVIPILKSKSSSKVIFYCHFPDLLLARHTTKLRKLYRIPFDWIEEITTGMADRILVNSHFTASTFARTFRRLDSRGVQPLVLYPAVDLEQFLGLPEKTNVEWISADTRLILSVNRFEKKKNVRLAVLAFAEVIQAMEDAGGVKLVLAGGFDKRVKENIEVLNDLKQLAIELGVNDQVIFLPSCSTQVRNELLGSCICVVYTPSDEHFGIVPLEAMAAEKPVIACNNGGPKESVVHTQTGYLCDPTPAEFASAMIELVQNPSRAKSMGKAARERVVSKFSRQAFGNRLAVIVDSLLA